MIFYFTGTGNSLQVAKKLKDYHGEELLSISALMNKGEQQYEFTLEEGEKLGFVFPVYAWGPPKIVLDFIHKLKLNNSNITYVYSVATCGENIGNTMGMLKKHLKKNNIVLNSGFSIVMPNNYIIMGMDVDSEQEVNKKLSEIDETLVNINRVIENNQNGIYLLDKGGIFPIIFTPIVNPLFSKYAMNAKKFLVKDSCTSCGICAKVCNTNNIVVDGKPTWGDNCTQCLACINLCPVKAIEYGKGTIKRGRYHNPNVSIDELGDN